MFIEVTSRLDKTRMFINVSKIVMVDSSPYGANILLLVPHNEDKNTKHLWVLLNEDYDEVVERICHATLENRSIPRAVRLIDEKVVMP